MIQYVGANAGQAAVAKAVAPGLAVRWEQVQRSERQLKQLNEQVKRSWPEGVFSIGIDTIHNQVTVEMLPSGAIGSVRSALPAEGVEVVQSDDLPVAAYACVSRLSCTRWRGGIAVDGDTHECTWGFQASRNGNLNMITAGHCAEAGEVFTHDGATIGINGIAKNAIGDGVDVSRTRVTGAAYPTTQNTLYGDDSHKSWQLDSVRTQAGFAVGQTAAKSGITTNYTYGHITQLDVAYTLVPPPGDFIPGYPGCDIIHPSLCPHENGIKTDVTVAGGDSGGPVYNWYAAGAATGTTLEGFASGGGTGVMYFAPAYAAQAALTLDFWCTTPGCP